MDLTMAAIGNSLMKSQRHLDSDLIVMQKSQGGAY